MQQWIVGAIVAYAFWVVTKRYAPKAMRTAVRRWSGRAARRFGLNGIADRLEKDRQAAARGDGCGSCGGCDSKQASSPASTAKEFVIPLKALQRAKPR